MSTRRKFLKDSGMLAAGLGLSPLFAEELTAIKNNLSLAQAQPLILVSHSSHLDLYWMAAQAECLEMGANIINDAINRALSEKSFHFEVEAARFAEYYLYKHPDRLEDFKKKI